MADSVSDHILYAARCRSADPSPWQCLRRAYPVPRWHVALSLSYPSFDVLQDTSPSRRQVSSSEACSVCQR